MANRVDSSRLECKVLLPAPLRSLLALDSGRAKGLHDGQGREGSGARLDESAKLIIYLILLGLSPIKQDGLSFTTTTTTQSSQACSFLMAVVLDRRCACRLVAGPTLP